MQSIIDAIEQWLKDFLIGAITGNLSSMFSDVNSKVATIATEVGKTPESWNSSVFSIILTLSKNVVVPIAGLVIAAVLTYELISMIIEKNNMHDIDTFMFFKWAFKSAAAAIIVNHTFDFIIAIFQVAQTMVQRSAGSGSKFPRLQSRPGKSRQSGVCVGIYAVLVNALSLGGDLQASIWSCAAYTVLLCFSLFKTGSVAKSILNAH